MVIRLLMSGWVLRAIPKAAIVPLWRAAAVSIGLQVWAAIACAEEVIPLSGGNGLLNAPKSIAAVVVLIPGLDGYLGISSNGVRAQHDSPIVSTRADYMRSGVASLLIDGSVSTSSAVEYMRRFGKPIVIVGLSNGARRLADGLGSHPAGFVIWSGVLSAVKAAIDPSALPPTLVIANHDDKCQATPPDAVEPFKTWAAGKVRVLWVGGGSPGSTPDQCNSFGASPHFMPGHEAEVVSAIAGFAKSVR